RMRKSICLSAAALLLLALPAPAEKPKATSDVQDLVFLADGRPLLIRLHIQIDGKSYLAAWDEFVNYIFDQYDKNKDGVLDRDEAARVPSPQSLFGSSGPYFVTPGGFAVGGAGHIGAQRDRQGTRREPAR